MNSGNVLVCGGAGYIGSHVCKALHEAGFTPVAFDNLFRGHQWAVKWGPFVRGDVRNRKDLDGALMRFSPVAVIHLADLAYVGESVKEPDLYYQNNVHGAMNLLEALRDHGPKRLVYSSSCAVYGDPVKLPLVETHPKDPVNPYGRTKLIVEMMLHDYAQAFGVHSIALRYFNASGADPDIEIGEAHDPETHLIPLAIQAAMGEIDHLTVFGRDYDTLDGTCIRDYVHVCDLASAHVKAVEALDGPSIGSAAYNLGTGYGHSVQEVITMVEEVSGLPIKLIEGSRRTGDPPELVADSSRVQNRLGWKPQYTQLRDIISSAWAWHSKQKGVEGSRRNTGIAGNLSDNPFLKD